MNRNIILTIGIPTYNGAQHLHDTIESILLQISHIDQYAIEILISDNASQDNTRGIVEKYMSLHPLLFSYYRNPENVGFDKNMDLVVRRSKGEFVWTLSDDDHLLDGSIKHVLNVISLHPEVKAIFVNYHNSITLEVQADCLCEDGNDFLSMTKLKSGLISSNIFNRNAWLAVNTSKYIGSGWIHMGFLVDALAQGKGFIIKKEYVEQVGGGRWGEGGSFIQFGLNLVTLFQENMKLYKYRNDIKKQADFVIKGGYPRNIRRAKSRGLKVDLNLLIKFIRLYKRYVSFWLVDLPFLLIPMPVFRIISSSLRSLKKTVKSIKIVSI